MSDRINQLIEEIKGKAVKFHSKLKNEKEVSAALKVELSKSENEVALLTTKINDLSSEIEGLKKEVETKVEPTKGNDLNSPNHGEIDELVREIEFCIEQLKK